MTLIQLSISILWFALGALILGCIVMVALWAVRRVWPVPAVVEQVVWAGLVILLLIGLLSAIAGTGPFAHGFRFSVSWPAHYAASAGYLQTV